MTLKARAKKKPGCRSRLATVNGWEYCTRRLPHTGWHSYIAQYVYRHGWKPKVIVKWRGKP